MNSRPYKKISGSYQREDEFLKDFLYQQETDDTTSRPESESEVEEGLLYHQNPLTETNAGNIIIPERKKRYACSSKLTTAHFFQPADDEVSSSTTSEIIDWAPRRQAIYIESCNRENEQSPFRSVGRRK